MTFFLLFRTFVLCVIVSLLFINACARARVRVCMCVCVCAFVHVCGFVDVGTNMWVCYFSILEGCLIFSDVCWSNSSSWTAKISRTISGRACQAWKSDYPHKHIFHDDMMFPDGNESLASNYCRDPDGKGAPWCFTTDIEVPWQFCDAPPCAGTVVISLKFQTTCQHKRVFGSITYLCIEGIDSFDKSRFESFYIYICTPTFADHQINK